MHAVTIAMTTGNVTGGSSRRATLAGFAGLVVASDTISAALPLQAVAEDAADMAVEVTRTRPVRLRTERAVAIRDDKDKVIANGIMWDDKGTVVSSYITFKDLLRKQVRLSGVGVEGADLGELSLLGFDPTLDIAVFRSQDSLAKEILGPPIKVITGNYVIGQSLLSIVRDEQGTFMASGIVSGLDRTIVMANGVKNRGLLQTDCPISLVSAGAGAWTEDGWLIGVHTPGNIPFASFRSDSGVNFVTTGATLVARVPELLVNRNMG